MARKKVQGRCKICGVFGKLSFEHVPPESAFNDTGVLVSDLKRWTEDRDARASSDYFRYREQSQRGAGGYHLCEPCNNNTGAWYAKEYAHWARQAAYAAQRMPVGKPNVVAFRGHPLRFIKQCVAIVMCCNNPEFADVHPWLRAFVLNRHLRSLPPQYDLHLTIVRRGTLSRSAGVTGRGGERLRVFSESAFPPFSVAMTFGVNSEPGIGRINRFADYSYDSHAEVFLYVEAGEVNTPYPGDFRTADEVEKARQASERYKAEHPEVDWNRT